MVTQADCTHQDRTGKWCARAPIGVTRRQARLRAQSREAAPPFGRGRSVALAGDGSAARDGQQQQLAALTLVRPIGNVVAGHVRTGRLVDEQRVRLDVEQERARSEDRRHVDDAARLPRAELAEAAAGRVGRPFVGRLVDRGYRCHRQRVGEWVLPDTCRRRVGLTGIELLTAARILGDVQPVLR